MTDAGDLATERLLKGEIGPFNHPNVRPRLAASLIVLDRRGPVPTVLMGRRHARHVFMPGMFVFPGGRVERSDAHIATASELPSAAENKLRSRRPRGGPSLPRALALAAVRETFEETGLLLGAKEPRPKGRFWPDFEQRGVIPALDALRFVARAITPPRLPRRFDTAFFAIDAAAIIDQVDIAADSELIEQAWVPLTAMPDLKVALITRVIVQELEARLASGMAHELPVPFYHQGRKGWIREEL